MTDAQATRPLLYLIIGIVILAVVMLMTVGCDDPPTPTPFYQKNGWVMIDKGPENDDGGYNGIYKKHIDSEHITLYATRVHYGWAITVLKD